jgi:mono/diheme cytochrome c family protein
VKRFLLLALALPAACGPSRPSAPPREIGRPVFEKFCAACHQPEGQGMEGGGPPLAGSPWVAGPESRLIRIVLHGLRGRVEIGKTVEDREMMGFAPILSDEDVAAVLTYVRARWGPSPAVSAATVGEVRRSNSDRTDYWPVDELMRDK